MSTWDDYYWPGTRVLRNLLDEHDQEKLREQESSLVTLRMDQLRHAPRATRTSRFDLPQLRAIHQWLFQDVYGWAGQLRTGPSTADGMVMMKNGHAYAAWPHEMDLALAHTQRLVVDTDRLTGLEHDEFVDGLAQVWSMLHFAHPFREGNTRTQVVFFDKLCTNAGHSLDLSALQPGSMDRDTFIAAREHDLDNAGHQALRAWLDHHVTPAPGPVAAMRREQSTKHTAHRDLEY